MSAPARRDRCPMMWRRASALCALLALSPLAASCSSPAPSQSSGAGAPVVTVMTRNMYFGADLSPLFDATSAQLGADATTAYQQLQQSDVAGRLQADAREIVSAGPDLVALQEAVVWTVVPSGQTTGTVEYDFVTGLQADLTRLGSPYDVAVASNGFNGALPVPGVGLVGLQDRDVILVRHGDTKVSVSNPTSGNYDNVLTVHVAGMAIPVKRGWAAVDVSAGGRRFHLVATHLEAYSDPVRDAQAQELLALVRDTAGASAVLGDVNSPAAGTGSQTYDAVRQAGLGDAWATAHPGVAGFTCCRAADLRSGALTQRIDMVFTMGDFRVRSASLVGAAASDRTAAGLWPSDHAGVVVALTPPG